MNINSLSRKEFIEFGGLIVSAGIGGLVAHAKSRQITANIDKIITDNFVEIPKPLTSHEAQTLILVGGMFDHAQTPWLLNFKKRFLSLRQDNACVIVAAEEGNPLKVDTLVQQVVDQLKASHNDKKLLVAGYSLGGAVLQLAMSKFSDTDLKDNAIQRAMFIATRSLLDIKEDKNYNETFGPVPESMAQVYRKIDPRWFIKFQNMTEESVVLHGKYDRNVYPLNADRLAGYLGAKKFILNATHEDIVLNPDVLLRYLIK